LHGGFRVRSTGGAPPRIEYGAVQENECREPLEIFREKVMASADRRYAYEDLVYRKGEHANALYVVTEGAAELSGSSNFMFLLGPWDIFGHPCAAKEPVRRVHAEAFTGRQGVKVPCKVIAISGTPYGKGAPLVFPRSAAQACRNP
jgi:CRP-like cAMP-binding protein